MITTIGTFDGVHLGHQDLLRQLSLLAQDLGLSPAVVTFDPTPAQVLAPERRESLLMSPSERMEALRQAGHQHIILLPFSKELAQLSTLEFMRLLRDKYRVQALCLGYDHHFGRDGRYLSWGDYQELAHSLGLKLYRAHSLEVGGSPVSSSRIRLLLREGLMQEARELLGYDYTLSGRVVGGLQLGRSLGYPTANIVPDNDKLIPADGVYAVRIRLAGEGRSRYSSHFGMLYIGNRPTLDAGLARTIEVNIFDMQANLYAQHLTLVFVSRVRGEQKFASLDELQKQIALDEQHIRKIFDLSISRE